MSPSCNKPAVHQNAPNPFNPETTLHIDLSQTIPVEVVIYNAIGQRVKALFNHPSLAPGSYAISWTGIDEAGEPVASGEYLAVVRAGRQQQTIKMMLVR